MVLHHPFEISSRLLPGIQVGGAWVQLEYSKRPGTDGRTRYRWVIDLSPKQLGHSGEDLQSGCGGGTLQGGFISLLGFISAAADSYRYQMQTGQPGENSDLFPAAVAEWASRKRLRRTRPSPGRRCRRMRHCRCRGA